MADFRVWDEYNSEEESADLVRASSADGAAIQFAENDIDGHCDCLYTDGRGNALQCLSKGQPISVRDAEGVLHRFLVGVREFEPIYGAVKNEGGPNG